MILSHTRRFIFIKTRKVSGTSMEISLSKNCGGDDVITPISYEDELVRLDEGGCLPQNYGDPREQQFRDLIRARDPKVNKVRHKGRFYNQGTLMRRWCHTFTTTLAAKTTGISTKN